MNEKKINQDIYYAYGSNLNLRQMARRCPTAKLLGTGVIPDYELLFRGREEGKSYLTVRPCRARRCRWRHFRYSRRTYTSWTCTRTYRRPVPHRAHRHRGLRQRPQ